MAEGRSQDAQMERVSLQSASFSGRIRRFVRGAGAALMTLGFWLGAIVIAWLILPVLLLVERDPIARRRRIQRLVSASWRWFLARLDGLGVLAVRYAEHELFVTPSVVVANHPTLLDVVAIIARAPHVCCVVKPGLVTNPLVGPFLRSLGHVSSGDGSLGGGLAAIEGLSARLREGFSVLIFPEGTRSPLGGLHPFRRGAFEIARQVGVPVVPLLLRCEPPVLGKDKPVWRFPETKPTLTVKTTGARDVHAPEQDCKAIEAEFREWLRHGAVPL